MNIRPRIIPKFQGGGVPQWYLDRYGNRTSLLGWNLQKGYNYANKNLNANDHRNAGNLDTVYRKNTAYTGTPGAVSTDIQAFYNSDGRGMSAEDFVNFYNQNAAKIRGHWAQDQTYNARTAGEHNKLFKRMFQSRSNQSQSPGSEYNIGYQNNLEDVEGSSTWLRRMDQYEKEFDPNNPDSNRLHEIILSDGSKAIVYKKANGDIGLLPKKEEQQVEKPVAPQKEEDPSGGSVEPRHEDYNTFDWNKIGQGITQMIPNLLEAGRLANTLWANGKIYDAKLKGVRPNLIQPYHTYRQVVGDEATKQAYYRRAAQGETKAAKAFTSDADRQMAYMMEAKRIGDEARAQGDLADNAEIRRTSDESNQHQWSNTQRDTEAANYNLAQLNYANAAKQDLLAQKYAADHSSWDNYLKGVEYRSREDQEEDKNIQKQLWALEDQRTIETDPQLNKLRKEILEYEDYNSPEAQEKIKQYNTRKYQLSRFILNNQRNRQSNYGIFFGARGMKVTRKKKDDLLYKSARDVVEHFRKMSKMSDDSTQRSRPKSYFRLSPHPGAQKMQQGGVAPFVVYTPVAMGGERSTTVSSNTSSKSSSSEDKGKETLDLIKSLFQKVSDKGLPIDVSTVYKSMSKFLAKQQVFGSELSTNDIASMYLQSMQQLNNIRHSQEVYEKAKAVATQNDALGEFAVTSNGQYIVQDQDGNVSAASLEDVLSKKLNPITNEQLLQLRAYSPQLAFSIGDNYMENVVNNGIGISKIADRINQLKSTIGSSEQTIEGYTKHESNQIRRGLELLAEAPAGDYKYTQYTKDQRQQMKYAFDYINAMLPKNMKAVLKMHATIQRTTPENIINSLLNAGSSYDQRLEFDAVTGKASKGTEGSTKGDAEVSAGMAFVMGQGPREVVEFNTGTSYAVKVNGIKGVLQTHSNENLGQGATLQDATKSQQGGYFEWNKATFGGSKLNFNAYNHIILNDSTIIGMDLPYTTDINGNMVPDFQQLKRMEAADEEIRRNNIQSDDYNSINQIYQKYNLPPKYTPDGKLIQQNYKRFAAIQATLDEQALQNKESILSDEVALAGDVERDLYEEAMKKQNKDYSLGDGFLGLWKDNLYKGTIFVPYPEDISFAAISSGSPLKSSLPNNADTVQMMQYAPAALTYKAPSETLSQIKSN